MNRYQVLGCIVVKEVYHGGIDDPVTFPVKVLRLKDLYNLKQGAVLYQDTSQDALFRIGILGRDPEIIPL